MFERTPAEQRIESLTPQFSDEKTYQLEKFRFKKTDLIKVVSRGKLIH